MSNHWRRQDRDRRNPFNRRRKKAGESYKREEDERDDAQAGRKKQRPGGKRPRHHWETLWEDEAMDDAGDSEEATGEQEDGGRSELPGDD
jgi:hypothetical protein